MLDDDIANFIFLISMYAAVLIISMTLAVIYERRKKQKVQKAIREWATGKSTITPKEFFKIRNAKIRRSFISSGEEFMGVYVAANEDKGFCYVGQSQRVLQAVNSLFTGHGNMQVFTDYKKGDQFTIRTFAIENTRYDSLSQLKRAVMERSAKVYRLYNVGIPKSSGAATRKEGLGMSVTGRVNSLKQPYGGYLGPKTFDVTYLEGGGISELNPEENVHPILMGLAVDYLTRFMTGCPAEEAFEISFRGACILKKKELYYALLQKVIGLDDQSIVSAIRLSGFDVAFRAGKQGYRPVEDIYPDDATIANVRTMVERSLRFFEIYGPKVVDGLTFEGGYTKDIAVGDGDFLTTDTLWDFKVSKNKPTTKNTLQILVYWRMGLHSVHPEYKKVKYLGIYNPRMNVVYRHPVGTIPKATIKEVDREVIGY